MFRTLVLVFWIKAIPLAAQLPFTNTGELSILEGTTMVVLNDVQNTEDGILVNDGELYIARNLSNNGLITFTEGKQGRTWLLGNQKQYLAGNMPIEFKNVVFRNRTNADSGFELSNHLMLYGEASFENGIVHAAATNGIVTFMEGAHHRLTSDLSHVDGPVINKSLGSFVFPIGNAGYYRMAKLGESGAINNAYSAQYFFKETNAQFPIDQHEELLQRINENEYWEITSLNDDVPARITLGWHPDTTPLDLLSGSVDYLTIAHWDADKRQWTNIDSTLDVDKMTVTSIDPVPNFGVFTLARKIEHDDNTNLELMVFEIMTPNHDGKNDYLMIKNIEHYPNNSLKIFNRWGAKVFHTNGYGLHNNVFKGRSQRKVTIAANKLLPDGIYYYIMNFEDKLGNEQMKAGFFYLKK